MCGIQCIEYIVNNTMHIIHCKEYNAIQYNTNYTMHIMQCIEYNAENLMQRIQCMEYIALKTIHEYDTDALLQSIIIQCREFIAWISMHCMK